jgi:hypothetical protein
MEKLKGLDFLVNRLQLGPRLTDEDWKIIRNQAGGPKKSLTWRMCYVYACQLVRNDGDVPAILTGAAGLGKGTQAIRILARTMRIMHTHFGIDVGSYKYQDIMENNIIYRPTKRDFNELLGKKHYNFMIIDEGYMSGINLESNTAQAIFIGKITNITRSKNNMLIFCFQNPTRATKFLMEAFYVWICKYSYDHEMVLARTKLFTTTQPWGLKKILDADNEQQIRHYLANNPNKAFYLPTRPLPAKVFEKYQGFKDESNDMWRMENESKTIIGESDLQFAMELGKASKAGVISADNDTDIEMYIRKKYPEFAFTKKDIKHIVFKFREYRLAHVIIEGREAKQQAV